MVSQPTSGKKTRLPKQFPTKKITSSSRRRPGDLIDDDVPAKSANPAKSKTTTVPTSQTFEGPGTSSASKSLTREERQAMLKQQKVLRAADERMSLSLQKLFGPSDP
ncbi:hypothetical protein HAX54_037249 [Datura stramonium]|uniref:Uncharacterized protein n=1 Tax=Datura stramonium TaxID=4076 RepID=A0ABS8VL45_DATST|nr:hypothetical protein [Datura stramonium]